MRIPVAVLGIALVPLIVAGQQSPNAGPPIDPRTRFEVVAIKALDPNASVPAVMRMSPGRFDSAVQAGLLLRQALLKADYEIIGMPAWADRERYAITAKTPDRTPLAALSVLVRNLLTDRFHLATHLETRELSVANLVLAKPGRLGPKLTITPADCQAQIAARLAGLSTMAAERGGTPSALPPLPGPSDPVPCGFGSGRAGFAAGTGRTLADVASALSDFVGRPVIDKTGLMGLYDFRLQFSPEVSPGGAAGVFSTTRGPATPIDPDTPSFAAALKEQLGLELKSGRGPVEVVVIDKFERPTLD